MKHYLNVCDVDGSKVAPVDIITFGSPCQDLSVAGKRAGLKHADKGDEETTRSGLFMEAVRIIKEMREATNGKYPRFALWENVPGSFSSNKGEDFRVVIEELAKIADETVSVPVPPKGKWTTAGDLEGDGWSLAWRTVDAQYHGVPQRRRRILLVADFAGQCAGKISFKCEGLRGYPSESGETGQAAPADAARSPGRNDPRGSVGFDSYNLAETGDKSMTLTSRSSDAHHVPIVVHAVDMGAGKSSCDILTETAPTLSCTHYGAPAVGPVNWDGTQIVGTLTANNAGGNQKMPDKDNFNCVIVPSIAGTIDAHYFKGQGEREGQERTFVAYGIDRAAFNQGENAKYDFSILLEQQPTMTARGPGATCTHYIVRRLTPTECARLQGFPDEWGHIRKKDDLTEDEVKFWNAVYITHQKVVNGKDVKPKTKQQLLTWYNKLWTDGAEYKMWGNGVALPCVRVPIHNMAKHGAKTMASLFDGSGGFPLAGVLEGIDPLWCSEIEPYPIAVTMERFPEFTEDDLDKILEEADL